ncbi:hypothetical protein TSOC_011984 [Tetrabaena socialis]|uniref:Uncharacterized protein n=1 Tax=Tetrabaena socialis TaxID=47790 RepID=A0A2J7ZP56_9CHLO|nr:hypothetical protein TSOC_011984 [Tetrabaena socialis]|eukprot:PNH02055.1 hypothetical protein TSOC_011984 [Tetrabaena socialis]
MISWWQLSPQMQQNGPPVTLAPGQDLTLAHLSLFLVDLRWPFGSPIRLPTLALSQLFTVPAGASLQLRDVVVVLSVIDMWWTITSICSVHDTDAFPHSPGVFVEGGAVHLVDHTSRALHANGIAGAGGEVRWINVTLMCPPYKAAVVPACAARPITEGWELGAAVMVPLLEATEGPIMLSLAPDVALPVDGSWEQVVIPAGRTVVLMGDPSLQQQGRRTMLDLSGLEGTWAFMNDGALLIDTNTVSPPGSAHLRDLQLINLPYSSRPREAVNLLAMGMQSFRLIGYPRVGGDPVVDGAEGSLLLELLQIRSLVGLVAFTNVTLVSASRYSGGGGTIVAGTLEEALLAVDSCGKAPSGRTVIMLSSSSDDQSVPPVTSGAQWSLLGPTRSYLPAAESCVVAGYPPALSGYRTFVNMQACAGGAGALYRAALSSPITLRDLVLYNLAPGGAYPLPRMSKDGSVEALPPAPQLQGADAPWANSSLPLWFFQCARSAEDLQRLVLAAGGEASPQQPAPRLVLSKVMLVVPEAEWRALAAAVLLQHAPAEMAAAQQLRQRVTLPPQRPPPQLRGVLVLAEALWYGVYGTDVTVLYKLPDDAPVGATLLSYPPLMLPYQELAATTEAAAATSEEW